METPLYKIKQLRSNRGGEYISSDFQAYCAAQGIHHQLTTGYSLQQNGIAERKNEIRSCEENKDQILLLMLYVDDLYITASCSQLIAWLKTYLRNTYDMTNLRLVRKYLGVTFEYLPRGIFIY